jgi:Vitamin K-dependent gamma-carboxylase
VSLDEAMVWTYRLLGFALALQTVELLQLRRHFGDRGVWAWPVLAEEHRALPAPLRHLFAALLPERSFLVLLWLRLLLALALAAQLGWVAPALLVMQLAIGARFRGTFNGGSDYMSVVVLLGASGAACFAGSPRVVKACLAYVCVQLVFSYFIAGVVKLARPSWRSGSGLGRLLGSNRYGTPAWLARLSVRPALGRVASWAVLAFECSFPLALLGPRVALAFLSFGFIFHVGNVLAFGLNRFLFAWLAAYPALLFFSSELGSRP